MHFAVLRLKAFLSGAVALAACSAGAEIRVL